MAPIRIAFIGLSAGSGHTAWAAVAHLPYLQRTSKYEITGICNSSIESGKKAIEVFGLPDTTKAYATYEELAADSGNYDLVVCSVRVDRHHPALIPILGNGKPCYVEWPLGKNLKEAEEMAALVKKAGGARTMVGLQARRSPNINKIRDLVKSGAIGRVLSVNVTAFAGNLGQVDKESVGRPFNDASIACNMLTIHLGHLLDWTLYASGELKSVSAILSTQRPIVQLKTADDSLVDVKRETPDQILVQGQLKEGGVLTLHLRGGPAFQGGYGLHWRIYGETGEIEVTSIPCFIHINSSEMRIRLHNHAKDTVEDIHWADDEFSSLPSSVQNVARLYEAYANNAGGYVDWAEAVERHRLLELLSESATTGKTLFV